MTIWDSGRLEFQNNLITWLNAGTWTTKPTISTRREAFTRNKNIMAQRKSSLLVKVDNEVIETFIGLTGTMITLSATLELFGDNESTHHNQVDDIQQIILSNIHTDPYYSVMIRGSTDDSDSYKKLYRTLIDVEAKRTRTA